MKDETVLSPRDETELAEAVAGAEGPLRVVGGGTRPIGAAVAGETLSTAALSGVTLYEPGALTIVLRAGTPVAEVERTLAAENQRLAFEPMDHRAVLGTEGTPTIGGVVAGNVSGPRRIQAGACRDFLLGVRFVDGTGTVVKNGGRVMKNVTGYDLVKLMAGSRGTLGVLSEVSLKVLPDPPAAATVTVAGLDPAAAVAAMSDALGSPYDVTGAAHDPDGPDGAPRTMVRIEGFGDSVRYRAGRLEALLGQRGDVRTEADPDAVRALWSGVRDAVKFAGGAGALWRLSVKPSDAPAVAAALPGARLLLDWGGGLIWAELPGGFDLRAAMAGFGGHATLVRPAEGMRADTPAFHPEPAPVAALSEGIRRKFDPRGILNPGLMA